MPTYNGASYFHYIIESLKAQSFKNFEVLFVDDCSTDNSLEVLKNLIDDDKRFFIYQLEKNTGSAIMPIDFALKKLSGEYYFYMSQDDWISADLFEKMHAKAIETNADNILPHLKSTYNYNDTIAIENAVKFSELNARQGFIKSLNWKVHGFSFRKVSLFKETWKVSDLTNQDEYNTRFFLLHSNKTVCCQGTYFYYKNNPNAITKGTNIKKIDWLYTDFKLLELIKEHNFARKVYKKHLYRSFRKFREIFRAIKADTDPQVIEKLKELKLVYKKMLMQNYMPIAYVKLAMIKL